jgi:hypothetical protein
VDEETDTEEAKQLAEVQPLIGGSEIPKQHSGWEVGVHASALHLL